LEELPYKLKIELSIYLYEKTYSNITFFKGKTTTFIAWICPLLKSYVITEDEYIYFEGDDVGGMYFLKEGSCGFVLPKHNNVKYINVDIGQYFGIMDIVCSVL